MWSGVEWSGVVRWYLVGVEELPERLDDGGPVGPQHLQGVLLALHPRQHCRVTPFTPVSSYELRFTRFKLLGPRPTLQGYTIFMSYKL